MLRARRKELGLTQEEVALSLNMWTHQYQRYEYGEYHLSNTRMNIGLRVCAVLGLDPYKVVFGRKKLFDFAEDDRRRKRSLK